MPKHPRRALFQCVFVLLAATANVWSAVPATQPSAPSRVQSYTDVRYGEGPGKSNLLDIYTTEAHDQTAALRPVIVWIHGGGWSTGDKQNCPALAMLSHGFAAVSINYRLSSQATYPAQIYDCKGAIRFLRAHAAQYHLDPTRIGVWGASAGGHLASVLGTSAGSTEIEGAVGGNLGQSSEVQAVCDWYGPTDVTRFVEQAQSAGILKFNPSSNLLTKLFGGSLTDKKDLVRLSNPIAFISTHTRVRLASFLIMHGDKDNLVPVAQSQMLYDALIKAGTSADLRIIPGAGHGNGFYTAAISKTVADFFESKLR